MCVCVSKCASGTGSGLEIRALLELFWFYTYVYIGGSEVCKGISHCESFLEIPDVERDDT